MPTMEQEYEEYTPNGAPEIGTDSGWNVFEPDTGGQFISQM
jgi:hypothetical protein